MSNPAGHPCAECGDPNAPFGLGPPIREKHAWLCRAHWEREPSTQKLFARRLEEALEGPSGPLPEQTEEDKATWVNHPGPGCRCPNCRF